MLLRGPWSSWSSWSSRLLPEWSTHEARSLALDCLGGNVAIVTVRDLPEGRSIVSHKSELQFQPKVSMSRSGGLNLKNTPSLGDFTSQRERINTLILVPPRLESICVSLMAGDVWVFGDASFPSCESLEVKLWAGNIHMVDAFAARVKGRNYFGDVTLHLKGSEYSGPEVEVHASTKLGDSRVCIYGSQIEPDWLKVNKCSSLFDAHEVRLTSSSGVGDIVRQKWIDGAGWEFLRPLE